MRKEIVFAGFGGQGIILMGVILAQMMETFSRPAGGPGPILWTGFPRRGVPHRRGHLRPGDPFPQKRRPDLMVFMSEESVKRYIQEGDPEKTLVIYDSTLIRSIPAPYKKTFPVPATQVAEEELKSRIVANMFMLGAIVEQVAPGSFAVLQEVVRKSVPPKSEAVNVTALKAGYEFARTHSAG